MKRILIFLLISLTYIGVAYSQTFPLSVTGGSSSVPAGTFLNYYNNGTALTVKGTSGNNVAPIFNVTDANSLPRLYVLGNGNVGIGTATPTGHFDILGRLVIDAGSASPDRALIKFGDGTGWKLHFGKNDGTKLVTFKDNGNVGIGTTDPQVKFAVNGNVSVVGGNALLGTFSGSYGIQQIQSSGSAWLGLVSNISGGNFNTIWLYSAQDIGFAAIHVAKAGTNSYLPLSFNIGGADRMRIATNGNIGIGTINPSHLLSVNGTIKAKEVIVNLTGWSDYVFAENYELMSLSETENFIKENKHLPDVPSEKEVLTNGVELGEMQSLLLKKIEELTLHVIEQEKKITALKKEIKTQKD